MMKTLRKPTHPGAFFKSEILEERGISITEAAKNLGVTRKALSEFVNENSSCSITMAKRLSIASGAGVAFWINMQANLDMWEAENMDELVGVNPDFWGKMA